MYKINYRVSNGNIRTFYCFKKDIMKTIEIMFKETFCGNDGLTNHFESIEKLANNFSNFRKCKKMLNF